MASFSLKQRFDRGEHATWLNTNYEKDSVFNIFLRRGGCGWLILDGGDCELLEEFCLFIFSIYFGGVFILERRFRGGGIVVGFKEFFYLFLVCIEMRGLVVV